MMIDIGTNTIETERLILRRFEYEDSTSMLKNWATADEVQWGYGETSLGTPQSGWINRLAYSVIIPYV